MVYNSPEGIRVLDLATMKTSMLVPNPPPPANADNSPMARFGRGAHAIVVGHKTNSVFFTRIDPETHTNALYKANTNTGEVRKLIDLPPRLGISASTPTRPSAQAPTTSPTFPAAIPTRPTPSSPTHLRRRAPPTQTRPQTSAEPMSRPTTKDR